MVEKIVFMDIDHTLSDAKWRDNEMGNWDEYHALGTHDRPIPEMVAVLASLHGDWHTVGLTGRPEKFRQMTMNWCLKHGVLLDELMMRPTDSYQSAPELKREAITNRLAMIDEAMVLVFDDRDDVVAAIKAAVNCVVCQVNLGGVNG